MNSDSILDDVPTGPIEVPPSAKVRGRGEDIARLTYALRGVELGAEDVKTVIWCAGVLDAPTNLILQSWLKRVRAVGGAS